MFRRRKLVKQLAEIIDRVLVYIPGLGNSDVRERWVIITDIGAHEYKHLHSEWTRFPNSEQPYKGRTLAAKRVASSLRRNIPVYCVVAQRSIGVDEHSRGYAEALLNTLIHSFDHLTEPHYIIMISYNSATPENIEFLRGNGVTIWYVDHFQQEETGIGNTLHDWLFLAEPGWYVTGHWVVDAPRPAANKFGYISDQVLYLALDIEKILAKVGRNVRKYKYRTLEHADEIADKLLEVVEIIAGDALNTKEMSDAFQHLRAYTVEFSNEYKWDTFAFYSEWNVYNDDDTFLSEMDATICDVRGALNMANDLVRIYKAFLYKVCNVDIYNRINPCGYLSLSSQEVKLFLDSGGREAIQLYASGVSAEDIIGC